MDPSKDQLLQSVAIGGSVLAGAFLGSPFLLEMAGWSASGVIVNSIAASWQSSIGAVASGSVFAYLQSMAATGYVGFLTAGGVSGVVAAAAAAARQVAYKLHPEYMYTLHRYLTSFLPLFKK